MKEIKPNKVFEISDSFTKYHVIASSWSDMIKKIKKSKKEIYATNICVLSGECIE